VSLQLVTVPADEQAGTQVPTVKFTLPLPPACVAPKFAPLIVTNVPIIPEVGEILLMEGAVAQQRDDPMVSIIVRRQTSNRAETTRGRIIGTLTSLNT
jgi:hypothetical protein